MTSLSAPAPAPLELIRARAAEMAARAQWPAERRQADRSARLRALLAHAVAKSPYYREALGTDIVRGDVALAALPTLSKQTLMREFDRIVTDPALHLAELEAHVAGPDAGTSFRGSYRVFATSGSSGFRAVIVHSEDEFTTWIAAHLPFFARNGIGPSTRLAAIGAPARSTSRSSCSPPSSRTATGARALGADAAGRGRRGAPVVPGRTR